MPRCGVEGADSAVNGVAEFMPKYAHCASFIARKIGAKQDPPQNVSIRGDLVAILPYRSRFELCGPNESDIDSKGVGKSVEVFIPDRFISSAKHAPTCDELRVSEWAPVDVKRKWLALRASNWWRWVVTFESPLRKPVRRADTRRMRCHRSAYFRRFPQ